MRNNIQKHIESLNSGYRCQLKDKKVEYINAYGRFVGKNKILVAIIATEVVRLEPKDSFFNFYEGHLQRRKDQGNKR